MSGATFVVPVEERSDAMTLIRSYVLPAFLISVLMSALSALLDLSIPTVSAGAAFGVAIWFWDRDRRAAAAKASQPS